MRGAYLQGANLYSANLYGANFGGADLNWNSHDLVAEILRNRARTSQEYAVAGLILMRREWCWEEFLACDIEGKLWAFDVLREWKCPHVPS